MTFSHEVFVHRGTDELLAGLVPFVREGLAAGEDVVVAIDPGKLRRLRDALGEEAERVELIDMPAIGQNPAHIIPIWQDKVDRARAAGRVVRGVGEPIWPERAHEVLDECHVHEALLNVAFEDAPGWRLMCPYDADGLRPEVVEAARRTHPVQWTPDGLASNPVYETSQAALDAISADLTPVPRHATEAAFAGGDLAVLRRLAARHAVDAGLPEDRVDDFVMAVSEVTTNSIRHGGGSGVFAIWQEQGVVRCEVRDAGHITDPLAGRRRPAPTQLSGRGLWLANRMCDLVQIRSREGGTVVRLHVAR